MEKYLHNFQKNSEHISDTEHTKQIEVVLKKSIETSVATIITLLFFYIVIFVGWGILPSVTDNNDDDHFLYLILAKTIIIIMAMIGPLIICHIKFLFELKKIRTDVYHKSCKDGKL